MLESVTPYIQPIGILIAAIVFYFMFRERKKLSTPKRIILIGKAASGKDEFKTRLEKKGYISDVSFTTRPMRDGEIEGKTYHYITEDQFKEYINNGFFHQWKQFNGWYYGTGLDSWQNSDVFIMTPSGIMDLSQDDIASSFIVYLDIPEDIRKVRLSERSDADSVDRRLAADTKDFRDFTSDFYDIKIRNSSF